MTESSAKGKHVKTTSEYVEFVDENGKTIRLANLAAFQSEPKARASKARKVERTPIIPIRLRWQAHVFYESEGQAQSPFEAREDDWYLDNFNTWWGCVENLESVDSVTFSPGGGIAIEYDKVSGWGVKTRLDREWVQCESFQEAVAHAKQVASIGKPAAIKWHKADGGSYYGGGLVEYELIKHANGWRILANGVDDGGEIIGKLVYAKDMADHANREFYERTIRTQ